MLSHIHAHCQSDCDIIIEMMSCPQEAPKLPLPSIMPIIVPNDFDWPPSCLPISIPIVLANMLHAPDRVNPKKNIRIYNALNLSSPMHDTSYAIKAAMIANDPNIGGLVNIIPLSYFIR